MKFLRSWQFATVVFVVFTAIVVGLIVCGVSTHREPGLFTNGAFRWDRSDFPLVVCERPYINGEMSLEEALRARAGEDVIAASNTTNARLGFTALRPRNDTTDDGCNIVVIVGVPVERGWRDPGGDAVWEGGQTCTVRTANVPPGMLDLVLRHELGHCLGLTHDGFPLSIMCGDECVLTPTPAGQIPQWITDSDRALLRGLYRPVSP